MSITHSFSSCSSDRVGLFAPSAVGPSVPWIYRGTYQQGLVKQQTGLRALGRETTVPFGFHGWRYGSCSPTPFVSHPGYFIATMGGIICKDDM